MLAGSACDNHRGGGGAEENRDVPRALAHNLTRPRPTAATTEPYLDRGPKLALLVRNHHREGGVRLLACLQACAFVALALSCPSLLLSPLILQNKRATVLISLAINHRGGEQSQEKQTKSTGEERNEGERMSERRISLDLTLTTEQEQRTCAKSETSSFSS